jgi:ABC-type dipeptide/oligopeptide/nickel transport system permease subunit
MSLAREAAEPRMVVQAARRGTPPRRPARRPALPARLFGSRRTRLAGLVVAVIVIGSVAAPLVAPHEPLAQDYRAVLAPPGGAHLLGTDSLGRDLASRILYGGRITVAVGVSASLLAMVAGGTLGLAAGFVGGALDYVLMRAVDGLLSFPVLLLPLFILAVTGPGFTTLALAIGSIYVASFALLTRALLLSEREREYVTAAWASGAAGRHVVLRHLLPNLLPAVLVQYSVTLPLAVLTEASLSFLGFSASPAAPSWGRMVFEGSRYMQSAPHAIAGPIVALALLVLSLNVLASGVRESLDPTTRRAPERA